MINFPFYCGVGGLGDFLLFLTTFYDDVDSANIIWFADNKKLIEEASNLFPKLKNKCIFSKADNFVSQWHNVTNDKNCLGTGITPKKLNYSEWYKIDIFKNYGVKENPSFCKQFKNEENSEQYSCIMYSGNSSDGKKKIILSENIEKIKKCKLNYIVGSEFNEELFSDCINATNLNLYEQMKLIANAKEVFSVDSWVKTWSSLCGIKTTCFDNIYSDNYLKMFNEKIDYGHYVFIFPFKNITFIKQK